MNRKNQKYFIGAFLLALFAWIMSFGALAATEYRSEIKIPVTVSVEGDLALTEVFRVRLIPLDGAPALDQSVLELKASKGQSATGYFTGAFNEPADFRYEVRQESGNTDAYRYDGTVYTAQVLVENADTDAGLAATVKLHPNGDTSSKRDSAEFRNVYQPVTFNPPIEKKVINDRGTAPADAKFHFVMEAANHTFPMPEGSTEGTKVMEAGAGSHEFGVMRFEKTGTYSYTLYEKKETLSNFTYDTSQYTLTINVAKGDNGLTVSTVVKNKDQVVEKAVFNNHYKKPGSSTGGGSSSGGGGSTPGIPNTDTNAGPGVAGPEPTVLGAMRDAVEPVIQLVKGAQRAVKTGDNSLMGVFAVCFGSCAAALGYWILAWKRRKQNENR